MLWLKCSISLFLLFSLNAHAQKFTPKQCLDAQYKTLIKHEGKFFGLIKNELWIKKDQCIIEVKFKNILDTKWLVDVCREPIHIKVTSKGSQSVYKRERKCEKNDKSDFCAYFSELDSRLQDHGLIFADGERENLSSSHGQTYCTYLLVKRYLEDGYLFSKFDLPANIFKGIEDDDTEGCLIPEKEPAKSSEATPSTPASSEAESNEIEEKADEMIEETGKF